MEEDEKIIISIEKTQLFHSQIKQDLLSYFHLLTPTQKHNIAEALRTEKIVLTQFLSSLKNTPTLPFEEIKWSIEKLHSKERKLQELQETVTNEQDIDNLLIKLEEI